MLPRVKFVNCPSGKRYITANQTSYQSAQKGHTCWYYSFNNLRLRIGKDFEKELLEIEAKLASTHANKESTYRPLLEKLKAMRAFEKRLSAFRKLMTDMLTVIDVYESLWLKASIDIDFIRELNLLYLRLYFNRGVSQFREYYQHFIEQKNNLFSDVRFEAFDEFLIAENQVRRGFVNGKFLGEEVKWPQDRGRLPSFGKIEQEIVKHFHLKEVTLNVNDIDSLIQALNTTNSPLEIGAYMGLPYFKKIPTRPSAHTADYAIYDLKPENYKRVMQNLAAHSFLIVGAEKGATPAESYVYIIDPNSESMPNSKRKAYKIPFEFLSANLKDKDKLAGVIKVHAANPELNAQLCQEYQDLKRDLGIKAVTKPKFWTPARKKLAYTLAGGALALTLSVFLGYFVLLVGVLALVGIAIGSYWGGASVGYGAALLQAQPKKPRPLSAIEIAKHLRPKPGYVAAPVEEEKKMETNVIQTQKTDAPVKIEEPSYLVCKF